jgi:predicted metal-dependent phosphoesterase TrpH
VLIDFHTHSSASDGVLTPHELLATAARSGISRFALTDHDTIGGYLSIQNQHIGGLVLISGVEISCVWSGVNIHVLGLNFDPQNPALLKLLAQLDSARCARAETIAKRLEQRGFSGALDGAQEIAGSSQIGRPHFARWLVQAGHVADEGKAFDRYLGRGKMGDVKTFWPALSEAVSAIEDAGGISTLAHPLHYGLTRTKLGVLIRAFKLSGGRAIEIVNGRQAAEDSHSLLKLAEAESLMISVGSDFHRETPWSAPLGVDVSVWDQVQSVWNAIS